MLIHVVRSLCICYALMLQVVGTCYYREGLITRGGYRGAQADVITGEKKGLFSHGSPGPCQGAATNPQGPQKHHRYFHMALIEFKRATITTYICPKISPDYWLDRAHITKG